MKNNGSGLRQRLASFGYAFNGIRLLIAQEANARIHCLAAVCAIIAGFWLNISPMEWVAIIMAMGLVIGAEAINSAIESLADIVSPDYNLKIKQVKDLSAAAVLFTAIAAAIIGVIIFLPKLIAFFC